MWGERVTRWILLFVGGIVLFILIRFFLSWGKSDFLLDQLTGFFSQTAEQAIEDGGGVLGEVIEQAPIDEGIKEAVVKGGRILSTSEKEGLKELGPEKIGEAVKNLPAEQAKEIKKELFGDFCREILEE